MDYQVFRHKNGVLRIFNKWGVVSKFLITFAPSSKIYL